jgi:hypothetical protein
MNQALAIISVDWRFTLESDRSGIFLFQIFLLQIFLLHFLESDRLQEC